VFRPLDAKERQAMPDDITPTDGTDDAEGIVSRMRAVADELTAAGLAVSLSQSRAVVEVSASLHLEGRREIEATVDEDGYTELRFWQKPNATPAQIGATISRALDAVTHRSSS
jgi:hypothetical protein